MKTNKLMRDFMKRFDTLPDDEQREIWQELNAIVDNAKLDVVEDAEKAISKLRTFSL